MQNLLIGISSLILNNYRQDGTVTAILDASDSVVDTTDISAIRLTSWHYVLAILQESHPSYQKRKGGPRKPPADDDKADVKC